MVLSDKDKTPLLISSLSKFYEHFVDALIYGRQTLSPDEFKSALNTKELQEKQEYMENGSGEGLTFKEKPNGKKKKPGKNKAKAKNIKYFLYHKEIHFKKDYFKKKLKKK